MLVSTKGRYALRLMTRIARDSSGSPMTLRIVSEEESISLKYLEQLVRPLLQAGLLASVRGKSGGYVLTKPAEDISVGDVLRAVEGTTSTVRCAALEEGQACPREEQCSTVGFWAGLNQTVERYVNGVSIADLANEKEAHSWE